MAARLFTRLAAVFFALLILFVSLVETSSIKYAFGARDIASPHPSPIVDVTYSLPHPGEILPGNPLWKAKALRDKISLEFAGDSTNKSKFELHLADKRLAAGWELWQEGNTSEALSTLNKAEKYLFTSYTTLMDKSNHNEDREVLRQLSYSSLKHREILEKVMSDCGDEARPLISQLLSTPKSVFENVSTEMIYLQMSAPANPF